MKDVGAPFERLAASAPDNRVPPDPPPAPSPQGPVRRSPVPRLPTAVALAALTAVAVLAALLVTDSNFFGAPGLSAKAVNGIVSRRVNTAVSELQSQPPVAAKVYQVARDGIVVVESTRSGSAGAEDLGTGIVVDKQGEILTALHVVQGGSVIRVTFADGDTSTATIRSSDAAHDLAVLTANKPPPVIEPEVLGGTAEVGEETFALGNPLGLLGSLSAGVISGLDRQFPMASGRTLSGMIQFDAAVNPGSSGGPLLNSQGQVIGIVTGLANPGGGNDFAGIGFAVPIATAGPAAGAPAQ